MEVLYDPVIPLLGVISQRIENRVLETSLYTPARSSIVHNNQSVEATQEWMNKMWLGIAWTIIHPYTGRKF
jgi:hypothetical protein